MGIRGRQSTAALAIIGPGGIETIRRPQAPDDLNKDQADEWISIVNRMPADWFPRETHGMLSQYCRHVVSARQIAQMIEALEVELKKKAKEQGETNMVALLSAMKPMDRLLKMQEREGRAISSLATRMRISQQSTVKHEQARKPRAAPKPWEES